ncbi:MAG: 16S rRNA (cytidine(1402)-2'-O)-methyltransferase [Lentisphaerae bacterium]|nr:16S rRNA (cytidine(1402)-2'-O)-methyltransferase [Lentisphaerota bacterium]
MDGKLYLVSTPIGNLEDITLRALNILKSVDLIAAEDTRHTRQLLSHFDIHAKLESCHAFNEHSKVANLIEFVKNGNSLALVSDAGTPSVADPGFLLVRSALEAGIEPVVIPGVSALTFSVTASALPVDKFAFWGFAPVKPGKRGKFFAKILADGRTGFFFESPFRIERTLREIAELSPESKVAVIREATKIHEEILRGSAAELAALKKAWKGEIVVGVYPDGNIEDNEE